MIPKVVLRIALLAGLAGNTWMGAAWIEGFRNRFAAEQALTSGHLDEAYTRLLATLRWLPGDAVSYVLAGRVIHLSQTNAVTLESLAGLGIEETYALGAGAVAAGLSRNPADPWAWFNLAECQTAFEARSERVERLKAAVEAAMAGGEGGDAAAQARGTSYASRSTVAAVLKAMELDPQYFFYHDFLANLYWEKGLLDDAGREMRAGFAKTPDVPAHPWMENREITEDLADSILAGIGDAARDPTIDPVIAARARADVLEFLDRHEEALGAIEALREVGGEAVSAECDSRAGEILQRQGEFAGSIPYLERASREDPAGSYGQTALRLLARGYAESGRHDDAVKAYRLFLTKRAGSLPLFLELASELETLGRVGEAEKLYAAMVKRFPEAELPYHKLIESLRRQRRFDEAAKYEQDLEKIQR